MKRRDFLQTASVLCLLPGTLTKPAQDKPEPTVDSGCYYLRNDTDHTLYFKIWPYIDMLVKPGEWALMPLHTKHPAAYDAGLIVKWIPNNTP